MKNIIQSLALVFIVLSLCFGNASCYNKKSSARDSLEHKVHLLMQSGYANRNEFGIMLKKAEISGDTLRIVYDYETLDNDEALQMQKVSKNPASQYNQLHSMILMGLMCDNANENLFDGLKTWQQAAEAGLKVQIIYKGTIGEEEIVVSATFDAKKIMDEYNHSSPQQIAMLYLNEILELDRNKLSEDLGNGLTLQDVNIQGDYLVYTFSTIYPYSVLKEAINVETERHDLLKQIGDAANTKDKRSYQTLKLAQKGITYRYLSRNKDQYIDISVSPEEMSKAVFTGFDEEY